MSLLPAALALFVVDFLRLNTQKHFTPPRRCIIIQRTGVLLFGMSVHVLETSGSLCSEHRPPRPQKGGSYENTNA